MSILSWNCRGVDNPQTVHVLVDLVHLRKPCIIFLMETISSKHNLQVLKIKLGYFGLFVVDPVGRGGGMAMFWKEDIKLSILGFSQNHIDTNVQLDNSSILWRFTGFYGQPEQSRRKESWQLLTNLAKSSELPWLLMGDFNDLLHQKEKRGKHPHPNWLIRGFSQAVEESGLNELEFEGHQFTWEKGRGTKSWVEEKLDRILASVTWFECFGRARATSVEVPSSDHLPLFLWLIPSVEQSRVRRFRFENMWIKEVQCREIMWRNWEQSKGDNVLLRLDRCRKAIWDWGKGLTKDFATDLSLARKQMESLRGKCDQQSLRKFAEAQRNYLKVLNQQNMYWKQRAKILWYKEGDENTKYFHNVVRGKRKVNKIERLKDNQGIWRDKGQELNKLMISYFQHLFQTVPGDLEKVVDCIDSKITQKQNEALLAKISFEEVKSASFSMQQGKSPGPDGLNPGFYQAYWDILSSDIVQLCNMVLTTGKLPQGINQTHIVLVYKKNKPEMMSDLRPIALCRVLYKIISKVLANRMKPLLCNLISENQCASVPGRLITDNVMLAYETQHFMKRKTQGKEGFAAIKLDVSKAYDRAEWAFLRAVMIKMGFDLRWVNLITECVSTVSYSILQEGVEVGPIVPQRGLRQGDPLSPYLFILITEGLSAMIRRGEAKGDIHGIGIASGAPKISHLLFADDSFIFIKANQVEGKALKEVLKKYGEASGQIINYEKSTVSFSSNVKAEMREQIKSIVEVRKEGVDENYLGLPLLLGRNKRSCLGFIKWRIMNRMKSWNHRLLSKAGREILLKTVIQALPLYAMSTFLLPKEMIKEIESAMNSFWWRGETEGRRGINWKEWNKLTPPKNWGGLGFRNLRDFNLAMLSKQAWRLIQNPNSLVARVYKSKYYPGSSFLEANKKGNPSFIWSSLLETQDIIRKHSRWRVGDGKAIQIWGDKWLPNQVDAEIQTPPFPYLEEAPVSSLMKIGINEWDEDIVRDIFNNRDASLIMSIPLSVLQREDKLIWKEDKKGLFTVKSCYGAITRRTDHSEKKKWATMWKLNLPRKIKVFFWQAATACLPTTDLLRAKRVNCSVTCQMCQREDESILHLFIQCQFAKECWKFSTLPVQTNSFSSFSDWAEHHISTLREEQISLMITICWKIWNARNNKLWNGRTSSSKVVAEEGKFFLSDWRSIVGEDSNRRSQTNQGIAKWEKPSSGWLKLNSDAAVDERCGVMGLGWVLRDDKGNFIAAISVPGNGVFTPSEAEGMAVREALNWLKEKGITKVQIETDALQVVQQLSENDGVSSFSLLILDIKDMLGSLSHVTIAHVKRTANMVAHLLAREACSMSVRQEWVIDPPSFIVNDLYHDLS